MNRLFLIASVILLSSFVYAQENTSSKKIQLTLNETIELAKIKAPDSRIAKNQLSIGHWRYRSYKSQLYPALSLNATLPNYNRSISSVTRDDGSEAFVERSLATSNLNLGVNQNIPFTNTQLFVNSALQRIDIFGNNPNSSYLSRPVEIGVIQPLFGYNRYRWQRKLEPLRYKESEKIYIQSMEQVSVEVTQNFFDVYLAKVNLEIAQKNQANNDTLYRISEGRYNLGKIAQNDLLQMELNLLNSNIAVSEARLNYQTTLFELKNMLGIEKETDIEIMAPESIPEVQVDYSEILKFALENSSKSFEFERRLIEAESNVAQAKGENGLNADVFASFGLSNRTEQESELYVNPQDQQSFRLGLSIPIVDWGRARSEVMIARMNRDNIHTSVETEKKAFERTIFDKVSKFNIQGEQLKIAAKADTIAQRSFEVAKARYLIGKISITDLSNTIIAKDNARRSYIEALKNYWLYYYDIRKLTLYDIKNNKPLIPTEEF